MEQRKPRGGKPPRNSLLFASGCGALGLLISVFAGSWPLMIVGVLLTVGPMLNYLSQLRRHRSWIERR